MKNNIGNEFMEKTQYQYLEESDQRKGVMQPPIELPYDEEKLIDLVDIKDFKLEKVDLIKLVENRKSTREYSNKKLSLGELSYLLWMTQGIKKNIIRDTPSGKINVTFRTVPSAGARHAFETFLLVNNVQGLLPGLYRYIATKHKLMIIDLSPEIRPKFKKACLDQEFTLTSAVTFAWVADSKRMKWRYSERSIRYLHLDAGHICQNLYLAAEAIESGVCAIAAFDDQEINNLLGLDGMDLFVTYLAACGKKQ